MSGIERLSDAALSGSFAGAAAGTYPVLASSGRAVAGTAKFDPKTATYNFNADNYRHTRSGIARAQTSAGAFRVACYGDSITFGTGASATNKSYVAKLRALMQAKLGDAGDGVHFATSAGGTASLVGTGGAGSNTGVYGPNGGGLYFSGAQTLTLTATCDKFVVWVAKDANGDPALPVTMDAVAQTAIVNNGTVGYSQAVYTPVSQASHALVLGAPAASKYGVIGGVESRRNGGVGAMVFGYGISGESVATLATDGTPVTGGRSSLGTCGAPDLVLVLMETNDWKASNSISAYTASMQSIITSIKAGGADVLLVAAPPPDPTTQTGTPMALALYTQALYALADTNNIGVLDLTYRWRDYATANAASVAYMADQYHPNDAGHFDIAAAIYGALASLGIGL